MHSKILIRFGIKYLLFISFFRKFVNLKQIITNTKMSDYPDFEENNNEEVKLSIQKFEQILSDDAQFYFDVDEFSEMIDFYLSKIESGKALEVIKYAQQQHPSSNIFQLKEAQVLAYTGKYEDALEIVDRAMIMNQIGRANV